MEETIIKLKAATALIQHMVSTDEEVKYNDYALLFISRQLYECIDALEAYNKSSVDFGGNSSQSLA